MSMLMCLVMTISAADMLLVVHFVWVGFVILLVPLIVLGNVFQWRWIRNRTLRLLHLAMIALVTVEAVLSITCPLTLWEHRLRVSSGAKGYERSFVADWLERLLYYDLDPSTFLVIYILFLLLVGILYVRIPPDRSKRRTG